MEMSRGHGSEDEQMVSQKRTYIDCTFTALQPELAFTVSSSARKSHNGKLPESAGSILIFCVQSEVISCLLYSSSFFFFFTTAYLRGPKGEIA